MRCGFNSLEILGGRFAKATQVNPFWIFRCRPFPFLLFIQLKNYVFEKFVRETMNVPDKQSPHKTNKKRGVRQKTFLEQVGVYGRRKVPCHTVTVIYEGDSGDSVNYFARQCRLC